MGILSTHLAKLNRERDQTNKSVTMQPSYSMKGPNESEGGIGVEEVENQCSSEQNGGEPDTRGKWARIFPRANSLTSQGMALNFVPLEIKDGVPVARLKLQEVNQISKVLENVVVLYIVVDGIQLVNVQQYARAQWPTMNIRRILKSKEGYYMMQLMNKFDVKKVVEGRPYSMN